MNTTPTPSAKDRVLAWVREKNPQTMELKFGCRVHRYGVHDETLLVVRRGGIGKDKIRKWWCNNGYDYRRDEIVILGSDMGLQELLIALCDNNPHISIMSDQFCYIEYQPESEVEYDLTQNLHNQSPEFYEALLPLLP